MRVSAACIVLVTLLSACGPGKAVDDADAATTSGPGASGPATTTAATTTAATTLLPTGEATDAADTTGGELPAACTPAEEWVSASFRVNHHAWAADGEPLVRDVPCEVVHASPSSEYPVFVDMLCTEPMGQPHEVRLQIVNTAIYPEFPLSDGQQVTLHLRLPDAADGEVGVFAVRDLEGALRLGGIRATEPDPEGILAPWKIDIVDGLCPGVTDADCAGATPLGVELRRGATELLLGHHQVRILEQRTYISVGWALVADDDPLTCPYGVPERLVLVLYDFAEPQVE